jgi:integrase/recombinase XerD
MSRIAVSETPPPVWVTRNTVTNTGVSTIWFGRRDQTLLTLAIQTGLRVSELTRLVRRDIHLGTGPYVRCHGKGRKERATPLTAHTVTTLAPWFREHDCGPTDHVFTTRRGRPLSTDAVAWLLTKHAATAARPAYR